MSDPNTDNGTAVNEYQRNLIDAIMTKMLTQKLLESDLGNETTKLNNNSIFASLLPAVIAGIAEAKDLNFVIECDIEGEQRGDRFEPKVKIHLQIGRDMDKVLQKTELDANIRRNEVELATMAKNTEKYIEFLKNMKVDIPFVKKGEGIKDDSAIPDTHS